MTGSTISFASTINDSPANSHTLSITGPTTFNGAVGGTARLASLSVTGTATIAANITTGGTQLYSQAVTVGSGSATSVTLTSTAPNTITFGGTVNGFSGGADSLTVVNSSGVTFGGAVGGSQALNLFVVNTTGSLSINQNVTADSVNFHAGTSGAAGAQITFGGVIVTATSQTYRSGNGATTTGAVNFANAAFNGPIGAGSLTNFTYEQDASISDAIIPTLVQFIPTGTPINFNIISDGGNVEVDTPANVFGSKLTLTSNAVGGTLTIGNSGAVFSQSTLSATASSIILDTPTITTTALSGTTQTYTGSVTLAQDTTLDASNGSLVNGGISMTGPVSGAQNLTVNGGTSGVVSIASLGTPVALNAFTVVNSGGTTVSGTTSAGTVSLTNTTGTIAFNGAVTVTTLNTLANGYNVSFNAGGTITNAASFLNTGIAIFGNDAGDVLNFTSGLATNAGPSATHTFGTVTSSNTAMNLGPATLDGTTILTSSGGAMTFNTVNGAQSFSVDAGAGLISFNGAVGGAQALDSLTITTTNAAPFALNQNFTVDAQAASQITLNAIGVNQTVGNIATPNLTLNSSGAANINQSGGQITAAGLTTLSAGGAITLNQSANNFGTVTVTSGTTLQLQDSSDITLNAVALTGVYSITSSGAFNINGAVTGAAGSVIQGGAGNDNFTLGAAGSVSGKIDGGIGFNLLNNSAIPSAVITPTGPGTLVGLMGTATGVGSFDNIELTAVISISPATGPTAGGTSVTVTGANFTGATAVNFGATSAASFTVNSDTSITCTSPAAGAGVVDITVTTPLGTSAISAADKFTFVVPPVVTLNTANLVDNATSIVINGANFDPIAANNTVTFNDGAVGSITAATATSLTVTFSTKPTGLGSLTAIVSTDGVSSGAAVQVATVVSAIPAAPSFTSQPFATPNPASVGQTVQFTAAATGGSALTFTWNFQDGTTAIGTTVSHAFAAAGTYVVSATVSDASGQSVSANVTVAVVSVDPNADTDGDGYSNEIEVALGSDPSNGNSTPLNLPSPTENQVVIKAKLNVHLDFSAPNKDFILLTARLPISGVIPVGTTMIVDVGGVVKSIVLTSAGRAQLESKRVVLRIHRSGSEQNFRLQLSKGSFAAALADEQLTFAAAKGAQRSIHLTLILLNVAYKATVSQLYTVQGTIGRTTTPR